MSNNNITGSKVKLNILLAALLAASGLASCGGGDSTTTVVAVDATPIPTVSVSASPSSIAYGATSVIAWSSTDSTSCTSSGGGGTGITGSFTTPALTTTTTYTVSCTGPGGTASQGTTVTIGATAPVVTLTAAPSSIAYGATSSITWTSTDSTSCTSSGGGGTGITGSFTTPALTTTTTYTVSCTGTGGTASQSKTVSVAAAPAPTVTLSASPSSIASGASTDIAWSSTSSTSCTSTGSGGTGTSGSFNTGALTTTTSYTVTCIGAGGPTSQSITITVAPSSIAAVAAAWATTPYRSGKITYYCDCGTGAEGDCVNGADANSGLTTSTPKRTIASAISTLNAAASGDTVALCKGGAFNAATGLSITSAGCTVGTTCVDLREYTPTTFTGTAKPIINNAAGAQINLFSFSGNRGGVRFLNLKLVGDNGALGNRNRGFFFYDGAHDVTMGNLDMDNFDVAIYNSGGNTGGVMTTTNIKLTGNRITNSRSLGFLGAGVNAEISYNYWDGNGSSTILDHAIYLAGGVPVTNMKIIGNYIRGQYGPTCNGSPFVAHVAIDGLLVSNNVVDIDAAAVTDGCWGIAFNNFTNATEPVFHLNATFSGNTVINGGGVGLTITTCPDCIIENNLIIQNWSNAGVTKGIVVPSRSARTNESAYVNTRNIIRNNTVWFGSNVTNGGIGIMVRTEGADHIIANNTVNYSASSGGLDGVSCFDYPLALTEYAFINNNHCYSAAAYEWVAGRGSLASWQSHATTQGFDSASIAGVDPMFVAAGTDFTPAAGSPLIGVGNTPKGSILDITGKTRPTPPAIGAFEF